MEELFIETKEGRLKIDNTIVEKYDLKKGTLSPFSRKPLVDRYGDFTREEPFREEVSLNQGDDEIEEMENGLLLSTSEMLDIAQGVDSDMT
jgi:hypothetical protein